MTSMMCFLSGRGRGILKMMSVATMLTAKLYGEGTRGHGETVLRPGDQSQDVCVTRVVACYICIKHYLLQRPGCFKLQVCFFQQ